eukprot:CAMPEP_0113328266 /NCGR_PEP_ID=MMETSP0010_2-20120614/19902_1 /TAXON_ID=216773 ORGANISM="Corethron hystrix, Strain 308" /NCGR_SAMPLE_ID=MMETSP0010_2 /ASSEMBLY_ACC=CAM_ASM_000155 /LENGTH=134 /DNA_ID=CAMNT_0000189531 /DNA_START=262 /DNA_END=663 /DNA_ORIENTATION=- /assembly_acc=CAM_ASM_000155
MNGVVPDEVEDTSVVPLRRLAPSDAKSAPWYGAEEEHLVDGSLPLPVLLERNPPDRLVLSYIPIVVAGRTEGSAKSAVPVATPSVPAADELLSREAYLAINKPPDLRLDGESPSTLHKLILCTFPPRGLREEAA